MYIRNDGRSSPGSRVMHNTALANTAFGGVALAVALIASSAAQAQNCTTFPTNIGNLGNIVGTTSAVVGNVAASITTVNTAFLTQSSAYVSAPANPQPGQQAGGIWVRGVGGEVNVKSASTAGAVVTVPAVPAANTTGQVNCNTDIHQTYAGVQVGRDIGKLDVNGWNLHFGTTAGYLSSNNKTSGGAFTSDVEVPFAGVYGAATYDRFFADIVVRGDYYQTSLNSPALNVFSQNFNAQGISVSGSAGYQFSLPNNWFIEPSVGVIHSNVKVDNINTAVRHPWSVAYRRLPERSRSTTSIRRLAELARASAPPSTITTGCCNRSLPSAYGTTLQVTSPRAIRRVAAWSSAASIRQH